MKFVFVTDASTDFSDEALEKYNIEIVPIEVRFGENDVYPEGLSKQKFYEKLKTGIVPKTSMPNAFKFTEIYKKYCNKPDVFVITVVISMELSQTKLQAQMAADELGMKNVFIEEGQGATIFTGALITEVARFAQECQDIEKIKARFYALRDKVKLFAIINDLKYLRASGRLSGASATIGGLLKVRPIVTIKDGKVTNIAKCMGDVKAEAYLLDSLKNMDTTLPIYILSSGAPDKEKILTEKYKKTINAKQELYNGEIGCVVGSHVGAGCYGFCFFEK